MQNKFSRISFLCLLLPTFYLLLVFAPHPAHAQYLASDLLGQLDANDNPVYTTSTVNNGASAPNSKGFSVSVRHTVIDYIGHRLFVPDYSNNRVLVFNLDSSNNLLDRIADNVLGQASFVTSTAAVTQAGLFSPVALEYDPVRKYLFVAQTDGNRVSVFDVGSVTDGEDAIYVLGQSTFTGGSATTTQSGMSYGYGLAYDVVRSRLFVSERFNNRVLVFDVSTMSNGMSASYVLGQTSFTSSTGATTQSGMSEPAGLHYDATNNRLFVSERGNNRVTVFDVSTITNGMSASYVLGQTSFTSSTSAVTQNGISSLGIPDTFYDEATGLLFVADDNAKRVLLFNASPTTISNGANAVAVLGQSNFTSSTSSLYTQSGTPSRPGLAYDPGNNRLYVSNNTRIIIFNFVRMSTSSLAAARADNAYSISLSSSNSQGTVSYATTSGSLPPGLTLTTSTGVISGTPTTIGTYSFTIQATDNNGVIGSFVSQPQSYTITVGPAATVTVGNNNYAPAPTVSIPTSAPTPIMQPAPIAYLPSSFATLETPSVSNPTSINIGSHVSVPHPTFIQDLKITNTKSDVKTLQQYLNSKGFLLAFSGPGSPGNETTLFGSLTKLALIKFQEAHADEILKPAGLTRGTGYFGPRTREWVNAHNQ